MENPFKKSSSAPIQSKRPQTDPIKPRTQWEHPQPVAQEETERPSSSIDPQKIRSAVRYGVFGIGGLIALSAIGLYVMTALQQKPDPLAITVQAPGAVQPGEKTQFDVGLANQDTATQLRDVTVTVKADAGTIFPDAPAFATVQRTIASVATRATAHQSFFAVFWGAAGDTRVVDVTVRYKFGDTNAIFEKNASARVTVSASPVSLNLQLPDQVLPGQNFLFSLKYANAGSQPIANAKISFDIPSGVHIAQSAPALLAATSTPYMTIPSFGVGQNNVISVKSIVDDNEGQGKKIVAHVSLPIRNDQFEIGTTDASLLVLVSPLHISLIAQGKQEYHATVGESIGYEVRVTNNYSYALKDVVVNADVSDPWFVLNTIQVRDGSFSSRTKQVTWNGGSDKNLLVIDPGKSEVVSFSVTLKNAFWANRKNNTITVKATVSASNKPTQVGTQIATTAQITNKVNGLLTFQSPVYFRDPKAMFSNIGTIPPHANQLNQYSVYVTVGAQGDDFHDLQVSTVLPGNVTFEGKVKGDSAGFVYNPRTNEIDWDISSLPAYSSKQIVFQVNFIPSVAQVGRAALILDKITFTGTDSFTGDVLTQSQEARFSNLPDDPSMNEENGKVAP